MKCIFVDPCIRLRHFIFGKAIDVLQGSLKVPMFCNTLINYLSISQVYLNNSTNHEGFHDVFLKRKELYKDFVSKSTIKTR